MPQITSLPPRFSIYALAGSLLGTALFCAHVRAADAPVPNIDVDVKKTQTKVTETNSTDDQGDDNGGGGGPTVNTAKSEIYYIITLHNNSNFAASNVEVDYSIYNRTRVTDNGQTTSTVDPITGTENVDIPANSSKDVETSKVPHQVQQASLNTRRSKKGGNGKPPSVTVQDIVGIWAQVKIGDTVVQTYEDPMDIKAKMDAKDQKSSGDDMDDFGTSNL
jgi:hypothetical protein